MNKIPYFNTKNGMSHGCIFFKNGKRYLKHNTKLNS